MDNLTKHFLDIQKSFMKLEEEKRHLNEKLVEKSSKLVERNEKLKDEISDLKNKHKELIDELRDIRKENTKLKKENQYIEKLNKEYQDRCLTDKKILDSFLNSSHIQMGKELFVPLKIFTQVFNDYCVSYNMVKKRLTPDFYDDSFGENDIEIREEIVTYKGKKYKKQPIIYGLDVYVDEEEVPDEY